MTQQEPKLGRTRAYDLRPPIFVLSPGRTGTVFLTHTLPKHYPHLYAVHEPPGSRSTLMLGNFRNLTLLGRRLVKNKMLTELENRVANVPAGRRYVEVNPMLIPVTDILAQELRPLRVLHMVRHPKSWVRSIRKFKASTFFRPFIDHIPLGTPFPVPRPQGWSRLDQISRQLWRWRYSNEQIMELKPFCTQYTRVRYEDLFGPAGEARDQALAKVLNALDLEPLDTPEALFERKRLNPAPPGERVDVDDAVVEEICGELMREFGYD